jgi:hypothetical protein
VTGSDHLSIVAPLLPEGSWRRALALDRGAGPPRRVVLSFVPPSVLDDPERLAGLVRDVEAAGRLHHPGAVPVLGTETLDDQLALVEPFRPAATVRALLDAAGRLPPDVAARIVVDACAAVARAHAIDAGEGRVLVHGGITPSRLLVGEDGAALVSGFGAGGGGAPDADVRALAAVLFECLAGEPPRDPASLLQVPGIPPPLAEAVVRALSPSGPTSAAGLAQAVAGAGPLASHADVATYAEVAGPEREGLEYAEAEPERGRPEVVAEDLIVEPVEPAAVPPRTVVAAATAPAPHPAATLVQPTPPAGAPAGAAAPAAHPAPGIAVQPTQPAAAPPATGVPAPAPAAHPAPGMAVQPTQPAAAPVVPAAPAPAAHSASGPTVQQPQPVSAPAATALPAAAPAPAAHPVPVTSVQSMESAVAPWTAAPVTAHPAHGSFVDPTFEPLPRPPATRPGSDPAGVFAAPAPAAPRSRLPLAVGAVCLLAGFAGGYAAARAGLTVRFSEAEGGVPGAVPSGVAVPPVAAPVPLPVPEAAEKPAPTPPPARERAAPRRAKASPKPAASGGGTGTPLAKGFLDVSAPAGAEVLLDGRRVGVGSVRVEAPVGRHHVEVRHGGAKVQEAFNLGPGETWTYSVTPTP